MRAATSLIVGLALLAPPLKAQETVGTLGSWDGVSSVPALSRDAWSASVGQTFLAPTSAAELTSFSFMLGYFPFFFPDDLDLQFYAYVMGWDGTGVTDMLWRSPLQAGETDFDLVRRDFAPTGVSLTPGGTYVAFLSTLEVPFDPLTGIPAYQNVGLVPFDSYAGGSIVQNLSPDFATLTSTPWVVDPDGADLAFEARFRTLGGSTVVPEPGSVILLATGLLGLGSVAALRRRGGGRAGEDPLEDETWSTLGARNGKGGVVCAS